MNQEILEKIGTEYTSASHETFSGHPMANFIRGDAAQGLLEAAGNRYSDMTSKGGAGNGQWSAVPWIALFDPAITAIAGAGFYVVYLFDVAANIAYLSLNQGTREVTDEFGISAAIRILRERASLARERLGDMSEDFDFGPIHFTNRSALPRSYEAGHILGYAYDLNLDISDESLLFDLRRILEAYRTLIFRGRLEFGESGADEPGAELEPLMERRRIKLHRVTERSTTISRAVKRALGYECQACGVSMEERYGPIGRDYIEAHHLQPISELSENDAIKRDPRKDFAVLCPNCHRMIHRLDDPSDLELLRSLIRR